jgi:hypothetical protein
MQYTFGISAWIQARKPNSCNFASKLVLAKTEGECL